MLKGVCSQTYAMYVTPLGEGEALVALGVVSRPLPNLWHITSLALLHSESTRWEAPDSEGSRIAVRGPPRSRIAGMPSVTHRLLVTTSCRGVAPMDTSRPRLDGLTRAHGWQQRVGTYVYAMQRQSLTA